MVNCRNYFLTVEIESMEFNDRCCQGRFSIVQNSVNANPFWRRKIVSILTYQFYSFNYYSLSITYCLWLTDCLFHKANNLSFFYCYQLSNLTFLRINSSTATFAELANINFPSNIGSSFAALLLNTYIIIIFIYTYIIIYIDLRFVNYNFSFVLFWIVFLTLLFCFAAFAIERWVFHLRFF